MLKFKKIQDKELVKVQGQKVPKGCEGSIFTSSTIPYSCLNDCKNTPNNTAYKSVKH